MSALQTAEDVARALVARSEWRWQARMQARDIRGKYAVIAGPRGVPTGWWPDLADPATAGMLLAMLVRARGGLFDRAMESIEECDPENGGRDFAALIDVYGLGFMCARALLAVWGDS